MNNQEMHEFFRKNELRMSTGIPEDQPVDDVEAFFDGFIKARSGKAFGFYIDEEFSANGEKNWDSVLWIPRTMIDDRIINVERLKQNRGFRVEMPHWFAAKHGVL